MYATTHILHMTRAHDSLGTSNTNETPARLFHQYFCLFANVRMHAWVCNITSARVSCVSCASARCVCPLPYALSQASTLRSLNEHLFSLLSTSQQHLTPAHEAKAEQAKNATKANGNSDSNNGLLVKLKPPEDDTNLMGRVPLAR